MTTPTPDDGLAADLHHDEDYFNAQYRADDDPWGFDDRWYERRKHALTVAMLPRPRYRRGVEPGCANGALTALLATRCDELHAFDLLEGPVRRARERLGDHPGVSVRRATFPTWWPEGTGDLVVWSEVAYYLTDDGADAAVRGLADWLQPGGSLVAVHWTGRTDYPRHGRSIGPWLDAVPFLRRAATHVEEQFDAGVWTRTGGDVSWVSGRGRDTTTPASP